MPRRKNNKKSIPTEQDLLNDLLRNLSYFQDTDSVSWGGVEEAKEKESIKHHIKWIIKTLTTHYNYG